MAGVMVSQEIRGISISTNSELTLDANIQSRPHVFIGGYFVDASGNQVDPTAGTLTIEAQTLNSPYKFESIQNGSSIDATKSGGLDTLSLAGNHINLKVSPLSISGNSADTLILIVSANES